MDRHLSFLDRYADPCFMRPPETPPGPTSSLTQYVLPLIRRQIHPRSALASSHSRDAIHVCVGVLPCVLFMPDIRCSHGIKDNLLNYGVRHREAKDSFWFPCKQNRKRRNREGKRRFRYDADQIMFLSSMAETVGRVLLS